MLRFFFLILSFLSFYIFPRTLLVFPAWLFSLIKYLFVCYCPNFSFFAFFGKFSFPFFRLLLLFPLLFTVFIYILTYSEKI